MKRKQMTLDELHTWQRDYVKNIMGDEKYIKKDNTLLSVSNINSIMVSINNTRWLLFADNGVLDNNKYYPLVSLSALFSNESKYGGTCEPTIDAIIKKAKECRKRFIS